jgi:ATP-dependent Clp protease ATP-binding subunit ClpX
MFRDELPAGGGVTETRSDLLNTSEIKATLDGYVIGQGTTKRTLAVTVYNRTSVRHKESAKG